METFGQFAHQWSNFFSALAQISGTLVGLVFVALTFKPRALVGGGDPLLGALARQTFSNFLLLRVMSLLMLTPGFEAESMGEGLLIMVALGVARIVYELAKLHAHLNRWRVMPRFMFLLAGHVFLGLTGVQLVRGAIQASATTTFLLAGVIVLLLSGCRSAWLLVVHERA